MEIFPRPITFQELKDEEVVFSCLGEPVQVRGFLHPNKEGGWLLSSQATLRSCCLSGRPCNRQDHLLIKEELTGAQAGLIALLEGTLSAEEGESLLVLQEAVLVLPPLTSQEFSTFPFFWLAIAFFLVALALPFFYALFRSMCKRDYG